MPDPKPICMEAIERYGTTGGMGRLDFQHDGREGQVYMQDSFIVHAHLAGLEGIPALFRLLDWGSAQPTWHPGVHADHASLHLPLGAVSILYGEHLQLRAEMEAREKERLEEAFAALEKVAGSQLAEIESVLKYYGVQLESVVPGLLPGGFLISDSEKNSYVIGSGEDCDVVLNHPGVEPLHCGLILEKGSVYIWDLGAQSGIRLNGVEVAEEVLKVGDILTLGTIDLRVRFHLRRPTLKKTVAPGASGEVIVAEGPPPKEIPKGAITYDKVAKQLKESAKGKSFLAKVGSLFGGKDGK